MNQILLCLVLRVHIKKSIPERNLLILVSDDGKREFVFIVMEYKGKDLGHLPKIALVGKGVTFDTGGLSIKPSTNMHAQICSHKHTYQILVHNDDKYIIKRYNKSTNMEKVVISWIKIGREKERETWSEM